MKTETILHSKPEWNSGAMLKYFVCKPCGGYLQQSVSYTEFSKTRAGCEMVLGGVEIPSA